MWKSLLFPTPTPGYWLPYNFQPFPKLSVVSSFQCQSQQLGFFGNHSEWKSKFHGTSARHIWEAPPLWAAANSILTRKRSRCNMRGWSPKENNGGFATGGLTLEKEQNEIAGNITFCLISVSNVLSKVQLFKIYNSEFITGPGIMIIFSRKNYTIVFNVIWYHMKLCNFKSVQFKHALNSKVLNFDPEKDQSIAESRNY